MHSRRNRKNENLLLRLYPSLIIQRESLTSFPSLKIIIFFIQTITTFMQIVMGDEFREMLSIGLEARLKQVLPNPLSGCIIIID